MSGVAPPGRRNTVALAEAALLLGATFAAYFPALHGGFVLDDTWLLTDNPLIKAPDGLYRIWFTTEPIDYWPVFNTTLWLEWRLWGMNPTGYHVTNLALHVADAWLVRTVLKRLSIRGGFFAAMLFAMHPVNVESVAWITQRKNLLAMLFALLAVVLYLRSAGARAEASRPAPPRVDGWLLASLAAFALAMLSKGSVAILPLLLLGITAWLRPLTKWDLARTVPFFLLALVLVRVNMWFQTHGNPAPVRTTALAERLAGAGAVVWFYLYKAVLPVNLSFVYPKWTIDVGDVRWWLPLLAAAATTVLLWRYRRDWSRPLLFPWGFFCVSLIPVMGLTDVSYMVHSLVADHYQHVALIGVTGLAAAAWSTWRERVRRSAPRAPLVAAAVVVGMLAVLTWRQSSLYVDARTLYEATLEANPGSWMLHNNLGLLLRGAGRPAEAIEHYQRALQLRHDYAEARYNLGTELSDLGRAAEAIPQLREALRLRPLYPEAHNNLGIALARTGQLPEAIDEFKEALRQAPDYSEARYNLELAGSMQDAGKPPANPAATGEAVP